MTQTIMVGIACHNRKEVTRKSINSLLQLKSSNLIFEVYIFEDGSTDGTREMISEEYPKINTLFGDGSFFWARSMNSLHKVAVEMEFDGFLMLNDDVELYEDIWNRLSKAIEEFPNAILVGSTMDSFGKPSYSGLRCCKSGSYYRLSLQAPGMDYVEIDSFNGNFVYIPKKVSSSIGLLDGRYSHHYADVEYGIRARKQNIPIYLLPGYVGLCESNSIRLKYLDKQLSLLARLRFFNSRFCHPFDDHLRFYKSIGGRLWILYFFRSYLGKLIYAFFPTLYTPS